MKLEEVRKEIDAIDRQLLPLFLKRMDCAKQVAEIKREQHLPVLNSDREQEILDSMAQRAGNYAGEACMLYATLMDMSRALQHNLLGSGAALRELVKEAEYAPSRAEHIACLGVSGSFPMKQSSACIPTLNRSSLTILRPSSPPWQMGAQTWACCQSRIPLPVLSARCTI